MGSFSFVISYDLCDNYYCPLLLVSHAYKGPKDQCEKDSEKMCKFLLFGFQQSICNIKDLPVSCPVAGSAFYCGF